MVRKTKAEKTREKIIETFFSLAFESLGILPNVSEICAEMDIYRSTFYNYFSSVDELVDTISRELAEELQKQRQGIRELGLGREGELDQLMNSIDVTVHMMKKKRIEYVVLLCPELNLPFRRAFAKLVSDSAVRLLRHRSAGMQDTTAVFVTEGVMASVYQWLLTQNMTIGEFSRLLVRFERSILTAVI
jgi:AcrR family transcriptional regulator